MSDTTSERDPGVDMDVTATLYRFRCGWCGAYEGTVDPAEPCEGTITTDIDGEPMLGGPHQFHVNEEAADVADALAALRSELDEARTAADTERLRWEQAAGDAMKAQASHATAEIRARTAERSLTIAEQCVERAERSLAVVTRERDRLRLGIEQAAEWFDDYAARHAEKGAADKAARNRVRSEYLRALLTTPDSRGTALEHVEQRRALSTPQEPAEGVLCKLCGELSQEGDYCSRSCWNMAKADKAEAIRMLDILYGKGPGGKMHYAYADGYFAMSIQKKFGMKVEELKQKIGYITPEPTE